MMSSWKTLATDRRVGRISLIALLLALFGAQVGCGPGLTSAKEGYQAPQAGTGGGTSTPPPPASGGSGTVVDSAGFFLAIAGPEYVTSRAYLHRAQNAGAALDYDDWQAGIMPDTTGLTEDCTIPLGTSAASANYLCVLEIAELDLYFNALQIQIHIPSSSCEYYRLIPYTFWAWEPGQGPSTPSYEVWEDGSINNTVNVDGTGAIQCSYDHGDLGGPNCCWGGYSLTVRTENDNNGTAGDGGFDLVTTAGTHAGSERNCIGGVGTNNTTGVTSGEWGGIRNNYPVPRTGEISGTGVNTTVTLQSALSQTTFAVSSNLWAANFINPTAAPQALTKSSDVVTYYAPNIAYRVECLDAAQDVQGRIGLLIRDWDEGISSGGNPDTGYGGLYEPPPYNTDRINDRYDWNDVVNFWGKTYPETDL